MKTTKRTSRRDARDQGENRKALEVKVISDRKEVKRFDELLGEQHYIGKAKPTGDFLRQVVVLEGEWVGLFAWGAACYSIKDRDEWIGWTNTQRAERQKLVVQNRRFLSLLERGKHPNQASRMLGAAVRMLPEQWEKQFGYRPLLAETFTDIEQFEGTCYKASGWEPVGMSKGYGRHRGEFYIRNDRPKKLWLKELCADSRELLCGPQLPAAYQAGGQSNAHGVMPLDMAQCRSLMETLQRVPDPRAKNSQFRIGSILSIVAMALLSGCRDLAAIHRFGQRLSQRQRAQIGLPLKQRGKRFYKIPSYGVYYKILGALDVDAFAGVLSEWLRAHHGSLPGALAMDGKMIRDTIGVVSLVDHDTGVPVAMSLMSQKEGEGERCEMKVAEKLLRDSPTLEGKVVSADPLHAQKPHASEVVEKGGDYLVQIKGNRPKLHKQAQQTVSTLSPLLSKTKKDTAGLNEDESTSPTSNR